MGNQFKMLVSAKLDPSSLNSISSSLQKTIKPVEIKLKVDNSQIKSLQKQIESLSKIGVIVGGKGNSGISQMTSEFNKILALVKQMNSTEINLGKLDTKKNSSQFDLLTHQLTAFKAQYKSALQEIDDAGKSLSTKQWDRISKEIEKARNTISKNDSITDDKSRLSQYKAETEALIAQQQAAEKIRATLASGNTDKSIANVSASYKKLTTQSDELNQNLQKLNELHTALGQSTTDKELIDNYTQYKQVLEQVNNQMTILQKAQSTKNTGINLSNDKAVLESKIYSYLANNTKPGDELKNKMLEIKAAIDSVDDSAGLTNLNKQFSIAKNEANIRSLF